MPKGTPGLQVSEWDEEKHPQLMTCPGPQLKGSSVPAFRVDNRLKECCRWGFAESQGRQGGQGLLHGKPWGSGLVAVDQ